MFDLLKKTFFASIGMAYLTKEKIEELGKNISNEANLKEEDGRKFIDELLKKSKDARAAMEKAVSEKVDLVVKKLDMPSRKDFDDLKRRVANLEENIGDNR